MWDNEDWAKNHLKKHHVSTQEAWDVIFEDPRPILLKSPDQLHYPPYMRYWAIGKTKEKRLLLVVMERHKETLNLITAYEPDEQRIKLYEKLKKK